MTNEFKLLSEIALYVISLKFLRTGVANEHDCCSQSAKICHRDKKKRVAYAHPQNQNIGRSYGL
jgi:hypothetical protein